MQSQIKVCESAASDSSFHATCLRKTNGFAEKVQQKQSQIATCDNGDPVSAKEHFFAKTTAAAKAGDQDAQMCYLQSDFELNRAWTREEVAAYRTDSGSYITAAFNRGDWRVVQLFMTSPQVVGHTSGLLGLVDNASPLTIYKMNRLARLGATGPYAAQLDAMAMDPANPLPAHDASQANTWAQQMYQSHFAQSPRLQGATKVCD